MAPEQLAQALARLSPGQLIPFFESVLDTLRKEARTGRYPQSPTAQSGILAIHLFLLERRLERIERHLGIYGEPLE